MSHIRPREFTQAEADEFKLAMRDPVKWKELYDKVDKRNKELYGDSKQSVNEHGFTDEEVAFLKESFPMNDTARSASGTASENMMTDDDIKFFDDAFEKGGRRRRKHRRTKKRTQRRSKKRTYHKKRHTKRRRM